MTDHYSIGRPSRRTTGKVAMALAAHATLAYGPFALAANGDGIGKPYDSPFGSIEIGVAEKASGPPLLSFIYRNTSGVAQDCLLPRPVPGMLLEWMKIWISSATGPAINSLTRTELVSHVVHRNWVTVPVNGIVGTEAPLLNRDKGGGARFDTRVPRGKIRIQAVVSDVFFASENRSKAPGGYGTINGDKTFPPEVRKWSRGLEVMRSNVLELEN